MEYSRVLFQSIIKYYFISEISSSHQKQCCELTESEKLKNNCWFNNNFVIFLLIEKMVSRPRLTIKQRWQAVTLCEEGVVRREVTRIINVNLSTIVRLW